MFPKSRKFQFVLEIFRGLSIPATPGAILVYSRWKIAVLGMVFLSKQQRRAAREGTATIDCFDDASQQDQLALSEIEIKTKGAHKFVLRSPAPLFLLHHPAPPFYTHAARLDALASSFNRMRR